MGTFITNFEVTDIDQGPAASMNFSLSGDGAER